jgi:hypothetical protein
MYDGEGKPLPSCTGCIFVCHKYRQHHIVYDAEYSVVPSVAQAIVLSRIGIL